MERRGCGLGCVVALLGLLLSCCLLPYLLSSIYSIATAVLDVSSATTWLWGDWISTLPLIGESDVLYMGLAEGPICCAGSLALLVVIFGVVAVISGLGRSDDHYDEPHQDEYEYEYEPESQYDYPQVP
jgi:hypothetical protein